MQTLCRALLDSRQRWRDLVTMGADLAYETDEWGRFVFVIPEPSLGWSTATLIGQPAELLLAGGTAANGFNPFRVTARCAAGEPGSTGPMAALPCSRSRLPRLFDAEARIVGTRGIGVDWTEYDGHQGRVATALRRGEVLDHILWRMGQEVLAPRMMQAALDALMNALGAEGAAVIDLHGADGAVLLHRAGGGAEEVLPRATRLLPGCERAGRCHRRGWQAGRGRRLPHARRCACRPGAMALARLARLGP